MADPTLLDSAVATWGGWSTTELIESVLSARGLTLDPATMRVVAIPTEVTEARDRVRRALVELTTRYPGVWSRLGFNTAWTPGDTSIALPASCAIVNNVRYGGVPLNALSREDYLRYIKPDSQGGGFKTFDTRQTAFYRVSGISDESTTPGTTPPDFRLVLELIPGPIGPNDADTLIVDFTSRALELDPANDSDALQLDQMFQGWTRARATEMWGEDINDKMTHDTGLAQRTKLEEMIYLRTRAMDESPERIRWQYPVLSSRKRGPFGGQ